MMPTEFKFKKHTKIVVDLEAGDKVTTDGWGRDLDGKEHTIQELKLTLGTQSGVSAKIDGYSGWLDTDWLNKINTIF